MAKTDEYIEEAYSELLKLSADDRKRLEYEARQKAVRDYNSQISGARMEGREEGSLIKLKEIVEKMLNRGMEPLEIADMIGEDPKTVASITDELRKEEKDSIPGA